MRTRAITTLAFATVTLAACGGEPKTAADSGSAASAGVDLNGAGATFPQPIYSKWFSDYASANGIRINYQPIGSGGGIKQLSDGTVDFGASDSPMTDDEMSRAKGGPILHFPTVLGAVVITYNLPDVKTPLHLTGPCHRRHLPRHRQEVERRPHRLAQPRSDTAGRGHPGGTSLRRQRHDLHLHQLPGSREPRLEVGTGSGEGSPVARRPRRQGQ